MYIDTSHITRGGKTYTRHLLRESYRANGKVLHRTIANVSQCSEAEIEAMRLALRHKGELEHLGTMQDAITLKQGLSFGAVWTVYHIARRLGIEKALGTTRESTFRTLFRPSEAILEGPPAEIGGGLYTHYCMRYNPLLLHRFLLNHNFL